MKLFSKGKIVVTDKLQDIGGAEIVLSQICKAIKPDIIVTTTASNKYDWKKMFGVEQIVTPSWGRFVTNRHVWFALYPLICFLMSFIRVSSDSSVFIYSSNVGKYISTQKGIKTILYSNYPARGIFFPREFFKSSIIISLLYPALVFFRIFEKKCLKKYEKVYVISKACSDAYKKIVDIRTSIINCPIEQSYYDFYDKNRIETNNPELQMKKKTFVLLSRLVDWKNLDYVFEYFESQNIYKLNVVGDGPLMEYFRKKYSKNCTFLGYLSERDKMMAMMHSFGLVFPTVQEWSMAAIEANALGVPVLGVQCGGTEETQIIYSSHDIQATSVVYETPTVESLSSGIEEFKTVNWDSSFIHEYSTKFKPEQFRKKIKILLIDDN